MNLQNIIPYILLANVYGNVENDFIIDYFKYKETSSVIGFSCGTLQNTFIRDFSKSGISTILCELNNQSQIHKFSKSFHRKIGIFLDLRHCDAEKAVPLFFNASENRMFDDLYYWLIVDFDLSNILNIIDDRAFGLATDFVIAISSNDTNDYEFYDAYNVCKDRGGTLNVTLFGSWNSDNRLKINNEQSKYQRRSNLNGLILRAMFFASKDRRSNMSLEDYLQDRTSTTKDSLSKFGYIIVNHLSELYNFKVQCIVAPDWKIGDPDGPIIRALTHNEIDITGSPASMNLKRTYLVKYVHQTRPFRSCFIFRSPQPKNIKVNEILGPFEVNVWYISIAIFFLCVWVMAWVLKNEGSKDILTQYSDSFIVTFGALCQQGTDFKMERYSTRLVFLCILIFSFLIYNYYSASIVSARLSEPIFKLNDSLAELAKLDFKFSSEWMIYFDFFIKRQDWETKTFYSKKWVQVPEADKFMEPSKALRLVQQGGFAYHMHPDVGYPYINEWYSNREICELTEVHLAKPTYSNFAVTVNSSFKEMIRMGLTKVVEVGLRKRQLDRWKSRKPECLTNILSASSINIYEFAPHLILLFMGMLLAIIIFIFEIVQNKFNLTDQYNRLKRKS